MLIGGLYVEVEFLAMRRHETANSEESLVILISVCIEVDLFLLVVQLCVKMKITHFAFLECEASHIEVSRSLWRRHDAMTCEMSAGKASELNGMEIDEVKDVAHVYILKVSHKIVG